MATKLRVGSGQSQELDLGLSHRGRDPKTWAMLCYFPRNISKEFEWEAEQLGLELFSL